MRLACLLFLPVLVFGQPGPPLGGVRDRYFNRFPFEKWQQEGPASGLHWSYRILPATLSAHQRQSVRMEIQIDKGEVEARREPAGGNRELAILAEFQDSQGRKWRTHDIFDLTRIPAGAKGQTVMLAQDIFIRPGDYAVSFAICDSKSLDHSFAKVALKVPPVRKDPLPGSDADLPSVEFVRALATPDSWFQPYLRGRLKLPVPSKSPVHVDLVMNMTPSQRAQGSLRIFRRNMGVLVPALRILAGMRLENGSMDIGLLDLVRRRTWEQKAVSRGLDWNRMREPFADTNPGIIDAQSLAAKREMLQFFWDKLLEKADEPTGDAAKRVVIVLSSPVFLDGQNKVEPAIGPKDPNRRVFYVRYRPPPPRIMQVAPDGSAIPAAPSMPVDELEHVVKMLDAKIYSVSTAPEFRKAVAAIIAEIGRM